jgi:uncharacterized Tic20 family protein
VNEIGPGPGEQKESELTGGKSQEPAPSSVNLATPERDRETKQWAMFIHFSILAGFAVPLAGLIVPILLWQIKKDELPGIVPHAYIVLNWMVTSLIYGIICFMLIIFVIGIFGLMALALVTVIYSIIGGIKANEGEVWEYPGTFVKVFKQ